MLKNSREERRWILNDWANSAYSVIITTAVLPIYFKDVAARDLSASLSTAYWGYVNSFSALLVALLAPVLGTLADFRGQKMRLFTVFTFLGVVSTAALTFVGSGDWGICLALYLVSAMGFAGMFAVYDSFLTDVSTPGRRDWVSSQGFAYGYIGSCVPLLISILLIRHPGWVGFPSASAATRASFVLTASWWLAFAIPMMRGVRQVHGIDPVSHPWRETFQRLNATLRNTQKYRPAFLFLLAYFFYIDGVLTLLKMSAVLGKDFGLSTPVLLAMYLYIQAIAFPCSLLWGKWVGRFGRRSMIQFGIGIYVVAIVVAYVSTAPWQFWIVATLAASSQGGLQALSRSAFSDLIPSDRSGEFFGFYNIIGRFAAILGPLLIGLTAQFTGNVRLALLALLPLFGVGAWLLSLVPGLKRPQ